MENELNAKESIRDTFIELYRNKNISNIRVTEIAKRASISRGTFYLYYEHIYDVRREIEDEILEVVKALVYKENTKNIFLLDIEGIAQYFTPVLKLLYEKKIYVSSLLSNNSDDYFETNMKEIMINNISKGINLKDNFEDQYVLDYMVSANIAVIKKWLTDDNNIDPKEIASLISKLTTKGPLGYKKELL